MGTLSAWLLIGVVFVALWFVWRLLSFTFDAITSWQSNPRPKTGGSK